MDPETKIVKALRLFRYEWPLHLSLLLTNWLPDNVVFYRLRGRIARCFLGSCGADLRIGRNIFIHNPKNLHLGSHVFMAYGACLLGNAEIFLGDEVMLGPYCVISSGNHTRQDGSFRYGPPDARPIRVGNGSWIGAHATLTAGVTIGEGSVIAAGAVVTRDIPSNVVAGGVPAKVIKELPLSTEPVNSISGPGVD